MEDEGTKDHGKKPKGMPSSNSVEKPSNNETPPGEESFVSPERKATPYADDMLKVAGGLEDFGQLIDTLLKRLGTELWDRTPRTELQNSLNDP